MCPGTPSFFQSSKPSGRGKTAAGAGARPPLRGSVTDIASSSIALITMADVLFHLKVEGEDDYYFFQVNPAFY